MARPASAARALHDVIADVNSRIGNADPSAYHAWPSVTGEAATSSGFAKYHAEVVGLFSEVVEAPSTLAPSRQVRYELYVPAWWAAIVRPNNDWAGSGQGQAKIIDQASLDLLAALADVVENRASISGTSNPQASEILAKAVGLLIVDAEGDTELSGPVREQILADLRHVAWLLANVDRFEVGHAVAAAEKVTGTVVVAATTTGSKRLKKVGLGRVAALTMAAGGLDQRGDHRHQREADLRHQLGSVRSQGRRRSGSRRREGPQRVCPQGVDLWPRWGDRHARRGRRAGRGGES